MYFLNNVGVSTLSAIDLSDMVTEISGVVTEILPVGIAIFGVMAGVKLVPKLIKRFMN